jgi:uncharacterized membrane protein
MHTNINFVATVIVAIIFFLFVDFDHFFDMGKSIYERQGHLVGNYRIAKGKKY